MNKKNLNCKEKPESFTSDKKNRLISLPKLKDEQLTAVQAGFWMRDPQTGEWIWALYA